MRDGAADAHAAGEGALSRFRALDVLAGVLSLSAFGPYVAPGIRTDNGLLLLMSPVALVAVAGLRFTPLAARFIIGWVLLVLFAGLSTAAPPVNRSGHDPGQLLAGVDNFVTPVVALLVGLWLVDRIGRERTLGIVSVVVVCGACGNAALAVAERLSPETNAAIIDLWGLVGEGGTRERAATVDRFSGIMQQPALAGVVYGLALILGTYLLRRRPVLRDLLWLAMFIGGAAAATKAFWFVGLPIGLVLRVALWRRGIARESGWSVAALVAAAILLNVFGMQKSMLGLASASLSGLVDAAGGGVGGLSGNRYGEQGDVLQLAQITLRDAPVNGYGLAGLDTSTDSGLLQMLVTAGLLGLLAGVICLLTLLQAAVRERRSGVPSGALFLALTSAVLVWSLGFPTLTGNRVALIFGLLFAVLLAHRSRVEEDEPDRRTPSATPWTTTGTRPDLTEGH